MKFQADFSIGGRDYSLSLDESKGTQVNDWVEWQVDEEGRTLVITAWRDRHGHFTGNGQVEVFAIGEDEPAHERSITFCMRPSRGEIKNKDVPTEVIIHHIVKDYQRMFKKHDSLVEEVAVLQGKLAKREREIEHLKRMLKSSQDKRKHLGAALKVWMEKNGAG